MANLYGAIALTGGGTGALDKLDGAILSDKDGAIVITESSAYIYFLDDDSGAAENSPLVITPDSNPGNKRWILKSFSERGSDFFDNTYHLSGTYSGQLALVCNENQVVCNKNRVITNVDRSLQ